MDPCKAAVAPPAKSTGSNWRRSSDTREHDSKATFSTELGGYTIGGSHCRNLLAGLILLRRKLLKFTLRKISAAEGDAEFSSHIIYGRILKLVSSSTKTHMDGTHCLSLPRKLWIHSGPESPHTNHQSPFHQRGYVLSRLFISVSSSWCLASSGTF